MARRPPKQLCFPSPPTWGGRRAGAGARSTAPRPGKRHIARPAHDARQPVHVTMRCRPDLPSLRSEAIFPTLCAALAGSSRSRFRLIQFSVQVDHLHLLVEAASREDLIRGLQGLAGRAARAVNRCVRRRGQVWSGRYHSRALSTPREVRNALVYVLLNFRKHLRAAPDVDPRSSGPWFDGWALVREQNERPRPVVAARTWLAAVGWRRAGGPIDPRESPA
jgi:putative transposase